MREQVHISRPASGPSTVTVTLTDGDLSSEWTEPVYGRVDASLQVARNQVRANLLILHHLTHGATS